MRPWSDSLHRPRCTTLRLRWRQCRIWGSTRPITPMRIMVCAEATSVGVRLCMKRVERSLISSTLLSFVLPPYMMHKGSVRLIGQELAPVTW